VGTVTSIVVGTNVRTWITYDVADATPEEVAVLSNLDSPEALALAIDLDNAGRLTEINCQYEDNPSVWTEEDQPAVIEIDDGFDEDDEDPT
jgi:hypothetical protein